MSLPLPRPEAGQTLIATVMGEVRRRIASRAIAPGGRVPSIRAQAETLGVSKSTVVEAYERLAAEGLIEGRPGAGFFVARRATGFSLADDHPRADRAIDPLWVMRQSLDADDETPMPGCGWLPADWMPQAAIGRALRAVARDAGASLTDYDAPLGFRPLREHLARRLDASGVGASPEQIVLTDSGTQAIDMICRLLIEPGDVVLLDDPCYFNFQAILRAHRARVVSVPYTPTGPDLARFAETVATEKPRLYLTNSALHNPTGATLAAATAHRILKIAETHDVAIVEDDIFADFENEPSPRLAAFDGLDRVIHIGSFSKTLSASMRCGFIAARRDWLEGVVDLKLAANFGNSALAARALHRVLVDGGYRRHMESVRTKLARAMSDAGRKLDALGLRAWSEPRGGMFLWRELPDGLNSAEVAKRALDGGVVLAPGDVFSPSRNAARFMRFNAAQCASPRVFDAINQAMRDARRNDVS